MSEDSKLVELAERFNSTEISSRVHESVYSPSNISCEDGHCISGDCTCDCDCSDYRR